jgi:SAM-dependent MidA family methyltransferase
VYPLKQIILETIRTQGPITFERFMEMALYYPRLGYYKREALRIGKTGDFYTSPHLHRLFGAMLGKQMREMWKALDCPDTFHVVEIGAGEGHMARDMLDYLKNTCSDKGLYSRLSYTIVELNATLKVRQESLLSDFSQKISWISDLNELARVTGCLISNELLDAFPVRVVEMHDTLKEVYVSCEGDDIVEVLCPASQEVLRYFEEFHIAFPKKYRTEVNLKIKDWLTQVSNCLSEGFIITIDYGYPAKEYYSEDRNRGTLYCYFNHQLSENPYENFGEQDITAHINFSALKKWAEECGLKTLGFCPQGSYLLSLGMNDVMQQLFGEQPDPYDLSKIKGLLLPQGMGESHKVMIHYKGDAAVRLSGFSLRNQMKYL